MFFATKTTANSIILSKSSVRIKHITGLTKDYKGLNIEERVDKKKFDDYLVFFTSSDQNYILVEVI